MSFAMAPAAIVHDARLCAISSVARGDRIRDERETKGLSIITNIA